MTAVLKQASNNTGLSLAREKSPGVVDGTSTWVQQEPNSYKDFGAEYKTVARNPINAGRQMKKGVLTDLDANGGWQEDLTFDALASKIEGLMYADFRVKGRVSSTGASTSDDSYAVSSTVSFAAGDIVFASGFTNAGNNGSAKVASTSAGKIVLDGKDLVNEASVNGIVARVGHSFADLTYTASTKTLGSANGDFTTLGLIVGEWLYVTDTDRAPAFLPNVGIARIKTIAAHAIVFDKIEPVVPTSPIVDQASAAGVIYFASRVIKNEVGNTIKRYTYQAERTLGKDDTLAPDAQSEYITGCVVNEAQFTFNTADKLTVEWMLMGSRYETRTSLQGVKVGNRPPLLEGPAYNSSTDVRRTSIELVGSDVPLYAYIMDLSITVKNNNKANKAIGVLGSIDHTEGNFQVQAAVTAYFANVTAATAISQNSNVTLDAFVARDQQGIVFDLPLVTLGDGRPKITANEAIQLPLDIDAATAALLSPDTNYTFLVGFFDYLPAVATINH